MIYSILMNVVYKLYKRDWMRFNKYKPYEYFIRKCYPKGDKFYTIKWWTVLNNGMIKLRRQKKKYVPGVKLDRDLTEEEFLEKLFLSEL